MADHIACGQVEPVDQPGGQAQGRAPLPGVAHHFAIRHGHMFDPDRAVIQADRVAAADVGADQLVDRSVAVDHEVGARARALAQFRIRRVGAERGEDRCEDRVAVKCSTMPRGRSRHSARP